MKTAPPIAGTWHTCSPDALVAFLDTRFDGGLSDHEAQERLRREGLNELPETQPHSLLKLFFSQFTSVIVWVLERRSSPVSWKTGLMLWLFWPLCCSTEC